MAGLSGMLTTSVLTKLRATPGGINERIAAIEQLNPTVQVPAIRTITGMNASAEITEKAGHGHYPAVLVYCDRISNTLREKFRQFSGSARLVVEVRNTHDKLDGLESATHVYVDAVCGLLDDARGSWESGSFYAGGYEVSYEPIARGGKNFLHRAKVSFDVEVSK